MATVNLGSIKFNWQGAYNGATAYAVDDVVSYNGSSYICKLASTGNLPTNTTYWDQMSSAGTDGTDLTTTLTTQGDIVYRDASGLARLGAGTSGQVLQTNGAGANPSWGTVSSDFVKLAETEVTTATSTVTFDGYFSSTYDRYKFVWDNVVPVDNNIVWSVRYRVSNAQVTSGNYWYSLHEIYSNGTTPSLGGQSDNTDTSIRLNWYGVSNGNTGGGANGFFEVVNPLSTDHQKYIHGQSTDGMNNNTYIGGWTIYGKNTNSTNALSGMSFLFTSGNIASGKIKLYGIK